MGFIRDAIKALDPAPAVADEQKELVQALDALATSKADLFQRTIADALKFAGQGEDQTVPVVTVEQSETVTHAYSSTSPSTTIPDAVNAAMKDFLAGGAANIVSGVTALIESLATSLLGEGGGQEQTKSEYYVCKSDVALWRVDLMAWSYQLETSGLTKNMQYVSAFCYTRSTVDVEKLNFQTFLNEYVAGLAAANPPLTPQEQEQEVEDLHALFNKLRSQGLSSLT